MGSVIPPSPSSTTKIGIRRSTSQDAQSIADLGREVFTTTFGYGLSPTDLATYLSTAYSLSTIVSELKNPELTTLVATNGEEIVGYIQLIEGEEDECVKGLEDPILLQRFYVHTAWHGQGVGRKLMDEIERVARGMGKMTIWLSVWEENHKSMAVYAKLGFEKIGMRDFVAGECVQRDWILWKKL
ncbi:acyl-CoA N-acyltransferase [Tricladium varicosporioides]|nr:acyl-CoA N-acyltransferase [Hymenoscyphus varicosporioides]